MYKTILLIITFFYLTNCSLDTKTGFWNKSEVIEENDENLKEIFKSAEVLEKEFNPNLRIRISSSYKKKPFINNISNNTGYINFETNFNRTSKFKFKKIKRFSQINPDLHIGSDNSLIFFDEKGSILKFNKNSKLLWKVNHYDKKQIKQKPSIYFASNQKILIAADSIANLYAMDYNNGKLLWKIFNRASFNSELKILDDKVFLVDFENVIRCISIKNGKEIWSFGTEKSFIKSQRKLSLIIHDGLVTYIDTFGDINALDINTGSLVWQSQTINEDIFESAFLLKSSRLVYDEKSIFVSNNQNKFFGIDARNGSVRWEQMINSYLDPIVIENLILTVSEEGYFFIIDKKNGNILRSTNIFDQIKYNKIYPTGFIAGKSFLYVSLSNGRILKVSIEDGKTNEIFKIDGKKISKPYIADKQMYILRNDAIIKVD